MLGVPPVLVPTETRRHTDRLTTAIRLSRDRGHSRVIDNCHPVLLPKFEVIVSARCVVEQSSHYFPICEKENTSSMNESEDAAVEILAAGESAEVMGH